MLKRIGAFLLGWQDVTIPAESVASALEILRRHGCPWEHRSTRRDGAGAGAVQIRLRPRAARQLLRWAETHSVACTASPPHGLAVAGAFLRRRPGIVLAGLCGTAWIFYSSQIVWDIRITGNTKTQTAEILTVLDEVGFGIGTYYPAINFNQLHADYAAAQHDIAWLSIYMNGTVAEIQVRELWRDERSLPAENEYANVVASCDGVVEEVRVFEGMAAVTPGTIVRRGDVLISGVVEKKDGGVRYEYAAGEVLCRVAVPTETSVALTRTDEVPTGAEIRRKRIKIFKKTINLFGKGGIPYTSYDKISTMEQLCPLGLCPLPVWIEETVYRETERREVTLSADDATAEAMASLTAAIREETVDGDLLERTWSTTLADGVYTIRCLLTLRRDIGETVPFTVSTTAGEAE